MIAKNKYDLIIKPVITEKSTALTELGKYAFKVSPRSNKSLIKKAVENIFGVIVVSINIINQKGKVKKFRGFSGRRVDSKKVIVTLEKDQIIDLAGGVK